MPLNQLKPSTCLCNTWEKFCIWQSRTLSCGFNVLHVCVAAHKHKRWEPGVLRAVQLSTLLLFSVHTRSPHPSVQQPCPFATNMWNSEKQWVLLCLLRAVGLELVYVVHLCVAACFHVCVLTELEQGALGGVFCCSWGATVLSPNRSLVPAVVPGEGFWMRGSNFTHIHTHKYAHTSSILSSSSASPTTLSVPLGLAEKQRGSGAGVGWDVWGGALWPLSY